MSHLDISRRSLSLYQAITELRAHQRELRFKVGMAAGAQFACDSERAYAASCGAEKTAVDNFAWPTTEEWLETEPVRRLHIWLKLYMEAANFSEGMAKAAILKNLQDIQHLEERLLKLADWSCEANHQDEDIRHRREKARQELEEFYSFLGHRFDGLAWTNKAHRARCTRCQEQPTRSGSWRSWLWR